jgi:hypothetical protein
LTFRALTSSGTANPVYDVIDVTTIFVTLSATFGDDSDYADWAGKVLDSNLCDKHVAKSGRQILPFSHFTSFVQTKAQFNLRAPVGMGKPF